jgi:hypothetical protein
VKPSEKRLAYALEIARRRFIELPNAWLSVVDEHSNMNVLNSPIECKNGEHRRSASLVFASEVDQEIVRRSALGAMTYLALGLAVLLAAAQLQQHAGITRIVVQNGCREVEPIIALGDLDRLTLKSSLRRHQEPTRLRGTQ